MNDLYESYYNWILDIIDSNLNHMDSRCYTKLISKLSQTPYKFNNPMDENRLLDGINLKYVFAYENDIPYSEISLYFNDNQASLLEVIIALSIRGMDNIIGDPDNRGHIFWKGIENMGLLGMDDIDYKEAYVNDVINTFLNGHYKPNGQGGLFLNPDKIDRDMRKIELWIQMMWYLDTINDY